MALMAGNGVVLKPSSRTPLVGDRIRALFERAGVPAGLVRVVHGDASVGRALAASPVGTVLFTGSADAGREVGAAVARRLRRPVLTLGGKDPMVVLADANLDHAIAGALWGAFANSGQGQAGIERAYVLRDVAERFVDGRGRRRPAPAGRRPARAWETEIGPLADPAALARVRALVDEAVGQGATLRCGGPVRVEGLRDEAFAPAVLTDVTDAMPVVREPVLGPVLAIVVVDSEDEAIAQANDSRFGLGASVWTRDRARGERIAGELQAGMVWINDHAFSHAACQMPWGGVKESGVGRTHSRFGFSELVDVKLRAWEPGLAPNLWWHPYDERGARALRVAGRLLYGRERDRLKVAREGAGPLLELARRSSARIVGQRGPGGSAGRDPGART